MMERSKRSATSPVPGSPRPPDKTQHQLQMLSLWDEPTKVSVKPECEGFGALFEKLGVAHDSELRDAEERFKSELGELRRTNAKLRVQLAGVLAKVPSGEDASSGGRRGARADSAIPPQPPARRERKSATFSTTSATPTLDIVPLPKVGLPGCLETVPSKDELTIAPTDFDAEEESCGDLGSNAEDQERFPMLPEYREATSMFGSTVNENLFLDISRSQRFRRQSTSVSAETYNGCMKLFISKPRSTPRVVWEVVAAFLIAYDMFMVPLAVFCYPENWFTITMDLSTLIFWTLNVANTLTLGFETADLKLVVRPVAILKNYMKFWFWIDLVVLVPDWCLTVLSFASRSDGATTSCDSSAGGSIKLLRSLRLVRLIRLTRVARLRKLWQTVKEQIYSVTVNIAANIAAMVMLLMVISHLISCIWFAISYNWKGEDRWITYYGYEADKDGAAWYFQYATALHWSITQFTPASMQITPCNMAERVFTIAVVVFALVGFSYVVGSITGSLTQLRALHEEESRLFWDLRVYLKRNNVAPGLSSRIQRYLEHAWHTEVGNRSHKSVKILQLLSEQLYNELLYELSAKHLQVHPLFQQLQTVSRQTAFRLASAAIVSKQLAVQDQLFIRGEKPSHMYVVIQGRLEYNRLDSSGENHQEKVDTGEDWIAEPVLWSTAWYHLGDCLALRESRLMLVDPMGFCQVVKRNPHAWLLATTYCRKFLEWLNAADPERLSDITQGDEEQVKKDLARFMEVDVSRGQSGLGAATNSRELR